MKKIISILVLSVFFYVVFANKIDSLKKIVIDPNAPDTTKIEAILLLASDYTSNNIDTALFLYDSTINHLLLKIKQHPHRSLFKLLADAYRGLGIAYDRLGQYDKSIEIGKKSVEVAKDINYLYGLGMSYNNLGVAYFKLGEYEAALRYFFKAEKIREQLQDTLGLATTYGNIGLIYMKQGLIAQALEYLFKSLKLAKDKQNKLKTAIMLVNIGLLYNAQGDHEKSLKYLHQAESLLKQLNHRFGLAKVYLNIGVNYANQGKYNKALEYYNKSLKIKKDLHDKRGIAIIYNNIANVYKAKKHYEKALELYKKSLKLQYQIKYKDGITSTLINIAQVYMDQNNISLAYKYALESYNLSQEVGNIYDLYNSLLLLSKIERKLGNYKRAYEYLSKAMKLEDSINVVKLRDELLKKELQYKYEKEKEKQKMEYETKLKISFHKQRIQKFIIIGISILLGIIVIFSFILYTRYRIIQRQRNIIKNQNTKLLSKNKKITEQTESLEQLNQELENKNKQLALKNKKIIESITYAKKIQGSLLSLSDVYIDDYRRNIFKLYLPRDIVSGDFYWAKRYGGTLFIAVSDCTGHGVPGALLSMLGMELLNQIINREEMSPKEVLYELRDKLVSRINPHGPQGVPDGMDIGLIKINFSYYEVEYSGANIPLYIITRNAETFNELLLISDVSKNITQDRTHLLVLPSSGPLIGPTLSSPSFVNYKFRIQKGDELIISSDGIISQFGGLRGKKLGYNNFRKILLQIYPLPVEEQELRLYEILKKWQGEHEQIDDITVIGIKI